MKIAETILKFITSPFYEKLHLLLKKEETANDKICKISSVIHNVFNPIVHGGSEVVLKPEEWGKFTPPLDKIQATKAVDLKLGTLIK